MAGVERKPRILKGFRDFLPGQMILRQQIIGIFREIYERHGFEPIDTPALEYLEILTGKAGENEKLMYHFTDHGDRAVGLRYDLTVPLARYVAMHQNDLVLPFKRYHIAPVWRAENPQRGRFREFWQCDADIVGTPSMLADAEIVAIMAEALTAIDLPNFTIRISHRRLLACLGLAAGVPETQASILYRAVDKLDKIGVAGVTAEMTAAGITEAAAARLLNLVTATGSTATVFAMLRRELASVADAEPAIAELEELFAYLPDFGVAADRYQLDLTLARGLDYYTGPVYEATVTEPKVGSVAGAGRYDGLVGTFLGRALPATGMSLGLERIVEVVTEHRLMPTPGTVAQILVIPFADTVSDAAKIASTLRAADLRVDLSLQPNRGLGDQLKRAGRQGIPVAVIVGAAELANGTVGVKQLKSGEQTWEPVADLATTLRTRLSETLVATAGRDA